jgi:hypothetical protein
VLWSPCAAPSALGLLGRQSETQSAVQAYSSLRTGPADVETSTILYGVRAGGGKGAPNTSSHRLTVSYQVKYYN